MQSLYVSVTERETSSLTRPNCRREYILVPEDQNSIGKTLCGIHTRACVCVCLYVCVTHVRRRVEVVEWTPFTPDSLVIFSVMSTIIVTLIIWLGFYIHTFYHFFLHTYENLLRLIYPLSWMLYRSG